MTDALTLFETSIKIHPSRGKSKRNLDLIQTAYTVLREIQPASVRAVCYQLFTRDAIPDMSRKSTQRVSKQLVFAREEEIIPWDWIVDETRTGERLPQWNNIGIPSSSPGRRSHANIVGP